MIHRIELIKYKCFKRHSIILKDLSIVVGKNNAGKSTMIEALRLIAIVSQKYLTNHFKSPPEWTSLYLADKGLIPSLKGIEYSSENVVFDYEDPPAIIKCHFKNKARFEIYLNENNGIFAQIFDSKNNLIKTRSEAKKLKINPIKILPQIGPLSSNEKVLQPEYVKANQFTSLSSLHFRNQIQYNFDLYPQYKSLFESTWPEIKISNFLKGDRIKDTNPGLLVRDKSFVVEAGKMGHGLQMWLQIIWFLLRCNEEDTIILDEPDVYLHADIQRKLIRILKNRFQQIIIATHSIEIISEVEPENILIINRRKRSSKYANNNPIVQEIINEIGSIQNLEVIRLWSNKRFIILEGDSDDMKFLRIFHDKIGAVTESPFDNIPNSHIDGWGGWQRVIGSHQIISKNPDIETYCILDSDYHTNDEIEARYKEAKKHGINLKIWSRKEIENYIFTVSSVQRLLTSKDEKVETDHIVKKIEFFCEELKELTTDSYATEIQNRDRSKNLSTANKEARDIIKNNWNSIEEKVSIVSGKKIVSKICKWLSDDFNISISKFGLSNYLQKEEIPVEVVDVIEKIINYEKMNDYL